MRHTPAHDLRLQPHRQRRAADASAIPGGGVNFLLNDGRAANQTVPHVHLHVVPRTGRDSLKVLVNLLRGLAGLVLPPGPGRRVALDADAEEIRRHLSARTIDSGVGAE